MGTTSLTLTLEGQEIQGSQNIVNLSSLPFHQCQHTITTIDCQPSGPASGMLVFVSGNIHLSGKQQALKFSQVSLSLSLSLSLSYTNIVERLRDSSARRAWELVLKR